MKDNAMQRKHHELEKASENHEHDNSNHSNNTFNKHIKSISNCNVIKESNEREKSKEETSL